MQLKLLVYLHFKLNMHRANQTWKASDSYVFYDVTCSRINSTKLFELMVYLQYTATWCTSKALQMFFDGKSFTGLMHAIAAEEAWVYNASHVSLKTTTFNINQEASDKQLRASL